MWGRGCDWLRYGEIGWEGSRRKGIKTCCVHVPRPHKECNNYVLQVSTDEINKRTKIQYKSYIAQKQSQLSSHWSLAVQMPRLASTLLSFWRGLEAKIKAEKREERQCLNPNVVFTLHTMLVIIFLTIPHCQCFKSYSEIEYRPIPHTFLQL